MRSPRTTKARAWVAITGAYLFFMLTFGILQGATGGGWWGLGLWTALYALIIVLAHVVPRVMRWIDAGEKR